MLKVMLWSVVILLLSLQGVCYAQTYCTQDAYDTCVSDIRTRMSAVVFDLFPSIAPDYLDDHCPDVFEAFECIEDFIWHCHPTTQNDLDGIAHAYEWICGNGLDMYRDSYTCLQGSDLYMEGQKCNASYHESIQSIPTTNIAILRMRVCQYVNNYLDCVQNAVHSFCDEDTSIWMREFDSRLLGFEAMGCQFHANGEFRYEDMHDKSHYHYHEDNSGVYGVVAFLTILVIMLVSSLVFCVVCFIVQKRRWRKEMVNRTPATRFVANSISNPNHNVYAAPIPTGAVAASTHAAPLPNKTGFSLGEDHYPSNSSYVRFENDEASAQDNSYATPEEIDITAGVGQYDLSPRRDNQNTASQIPQDHSPRVDREENTELNIDNTGYVNTSDA